MDATGAAARPVGGDHRDGHGHGDGHGNELPLLRERLNREYAGIVAPGTVWRCLRAAEEALELFGAVDGDAPRLLERLARADLQQIADGRESGARVYGVHRARRR